VTLPSFSFDTLSYPNFIHPPSFAEVHQTLTYEPEASSICSLREFKMSVLKSPQNGLWTWGRSRPK